MRFIPKLSNRTSASCTHLLDNVKFKYILLVARAKIFNSWWHVGGSGQEGHLTLVAFVLSCRSCDESCIRYSHKLRRTYILNISNGSRVMQRQGRAPCSYRTLFSTMLVHTKGKSGDRLGGKSRFMDRAHSTSEFGQPRLDQQEIFSDKDAIAPRWSNERRMTRDALYTVNRRCVLGFPASDHTWQTRSDRCKEPYLRPS